MKYFLIIIVVLLIGAGAYFFLSPDPIFFTKDPVDTPPVVEEEEQEEEVISREEEEEEPEEDLAERVIGRSVDGRDIIAYHFGEGDREVLFVGGVHGGYSWNTALIGYALVDHFETNSGSIPSNLKVTVIPVLNPDGLYEVVGTEGRFTSSDVSGNRTAGRFNANEVDLNRNFDCNWETTSMWQERVVDAGSEPFSEPEVKALRDYVLKNEPVATVMYFSAGGGVYSSSCNGPASAQTQRLMNVYANASGYSAEGVFDSYKITGDAADWMAKMGLPAISVILTSHESTDWSKNRNGVNAILEEYGN